MSLTHLLKSTLLRRHEGRIFSSAAWYRATQMHQCNKIAPKIEGQPYTQQPYTFRDAFHPFRDALYNDASIALIVLPLLASFLTLPILARDKYIHDISERWCKKAGIEASEENLENRKRIFAYNLPLSDWFSPFY